MSRLRELIAELCPDGVEYKALGQCLLSLRTGLNPRKNFVLNTPDATNYYVTVRELGGVRVCPSDKTDLVNDEALALINRRSHLNAGDVLFSGVGTVGRTAYIDTTPENWNIKEGVYALTANAALLASKYLLWFLLSDLARTQFTSGTDGGTVASLSMASLKKLRIPVPPIEVQREIVRILDSFQELDDALTAEIDARENQVEYCRSKMIGSIPELFRVPLGQVADVFDGVHKTPTYTDKGIRFVSVENIDDLHGSKKYISRNDFLKNYKTSPVCGDVLMTRIGTIGKCALVDDVEPLAYYVSLSLIRPHVGDLEPSYLRHVLESGLGRVELRKRTIDTAVPIKINLGEIGKLSIPVPSVAEQKSILSQLDGMLLFVNTLKNEREARRKQFAYYRDKLLDLPEKVTT